MLIPAAARGKRRPTLRAQQFAAPFACMSHTFCVDLNQKRAEGPNCDLLFPMRRTAVYEINSITSEKSGYRNQSAQTDSI